MNVSEYELSRLKTIIDNQSYVIENLSNRILQSEVLISSLTDLLISHEILNNDELNEMMETKINIISQKIDKIKEENEKKIKPFPYFGGMGEA